MVLECLKWIPELWMQLVTSLIDGKRNMDIMIRDLPDNVVVDILTRLPAESVAKCRRVSKHWLALTSSPYFAEIHVKRASSNLLVQCIAMPHSQERVRVCFSMFEEYKVDFLLYEDFNSRMDGKFKKISDRRGVMVMKEGDSIKSLVLVGCCDGLVVLWSGAIYYVCNIVSRENVVIRPPPPRPSSIIFFGMFFDPVAREYKLLFRGETRSPDDHLYHVFIYSSRSKLWREVANNASLSYRPRIGHPTVPVVLNNDTSSSGSRLYWMSDSYKDGIDYDIANCCRNSIIMFKADAENFRYMQHPGGLCESLHGHYRYGLLEMDGHLCCGVCSGGFSSAMVSIFVSMEEEDHNKTTTSSCWVWRYKVDLGLDKKKFPFHGPALNCLIWLWKIENGELFVYWFLEGCSDVICSVIP